MLSTSVSTINSRIRGKKGGEILLLTSSQCLGVKEELPDEGPAPEPGAIFPFDQFVSLVYLGERFPNLNGFFK